MQTHARAALRCSGCLREGHMPEPRRSLLCHVWESVYYVPQLLLFSVVVLGEESLLSSTETDEIMHQRAQVGLVAINLKERWFPWGPHIINCHLVYHDLIFRTAFFATAFLNISLQRLYWLQTTWLDRFIKQSQLKCWLKWFGWLLTLNFTCSFLMFKSFWMMCSTVGLSLFMLLMSKFCAVNHTKLLYGFKRLAIYCTSHMD